MSTGNETNEQTPKLDIPAIERELTALWKQASEDEDGGVVRASILNLLIYVPSAADVRDVDDIIIDITVSHPCRAILIIADRDVADSPLTAEVASRCTIPIGSSKQVCCEQVTITAGRAQVEEIPSAVSPLLLSDLPVYFWWRGTPKFVDRHLFRRLVDLADRVIIDSAQFPDPQRDLVALAAAVRDSSRWAAISDLNWGRLTAWRSLLAGFYDVAEYRPLLDQLSSVAIEYAPPAQDKSAIPTRALLLAGWLSSRLGWKLDPKGERTTRAGMHFEAKTKDRRSLAIEFEATERDVKAGHIALVTLRSAADPSVSFTIKTSADGSRIETGVNRGQEASIQRVLSYENMNESELVGGEIEILGHDAVYEEAVLKAEEFVAGR